MTHLLRILYGLNRFSEDLDFSLLKPDPHFNLLPYLKAVEEELEISGLKVNVEHKIKHPTETIRSAFLKPGTLETFIRIGLDEQLKKHTQSNEIIKIKLEIDIDPPAGLFYRNSLSYETYSIFVFVSYIQEDLFAGKMHALLCRPYKVRVKGRDWYDLIWYVVKKFRFAFSSFGNANEAIRALFLSNAPHRKSLHTNPQRKNRGTEYWNSQRRYPQIHSRSARNGWMVKRILFKSYPPNSVQTPKIGSSEAGFSPASIT